jgi:exopolysaccharide biosynthesis protein
MNDTVLILEEPQPIAPKNRKPENNEQKNGKKKNIILSRILISAGSFLLFLIVAVFATCHLLLNGPSETMRDALVLSAKQASATKWLPGLFLDRETVSEIEFNSKTVTYDVVSMQDAAEEEKQEADEWADAIDGMRLVFISKPTFKAYLLMVRDPSRVFVGTSSDFKSGKPGMRIFEMADKYGAVAALNAGEYPDTGGVGTGEHPIGITYAEGKLVYDGHADRTFMGITNENKLWVSEGMTKARAAELGIRDGVCFQKGNCLITNDGENMTLHYADGNTGRSQRTAIGQRADGTILLLATDGRTASSIGATHNELIEIMLEYGAVMAGNLDGGSSTMLYYRNYFDLYGIDPAGLDEYQRKGLVNTYKAFTNPRKIPTYFLVKGSE